MFVCVDVHSDLRLNAEPHSESGQKIRSSVSQLRVCNVMYEPLSPSRRYLNDVIYEKRFTWRSFGGPEEAGRWGEQEALLLKCAQPRTQHTATAVVGQGSQPSEFR